MNKKSFVLILSILFFPLSFICAQEAAANPDDEIVFSISPVTAYKNGMLGEYVYVKDVNNQEQKLSELDWEIRNLFSLGLDFQIDFKKFTLDAGITFGISNHNGKMQDSDWLNFITAYDFIDPLVKTTYSVSDLEYKKAINADFNFIYKLFDDKKFSLLPYFCVNIDYSDFFASNGHGWYGNASNPPVKWDSPEALYYAPGELGCISYTRQTYLTFIGIKNRSTFDKFFFELDLAVSPFVYITSLDIHYQVNGMAAKFLDDEIFGFFSTFRIKLLAQYNFTKNHAAYIGFEYLLQNQIQGTTFSSSDQSKWYKNTTAYPKADGSYSNFTLGYRFSF